MLVFFIVAFAYIGASLGKLYFSKVDIFFVNKRKELVFKDRKSYFTFLLVPFLFLLSRKKRKSVDKKVVRILSVCEVVGVISLTLLSISYYAFYKSTSFDSNQYVELIISFVIPFLVTIALLYLSIYDILVMMVPGDFLKKFFFVAIILNIIFGILSLLGFSIYTVKLGTIDNLLTGFCLGFFVLILRKYTNNKGIGEAEFELMFSMGLLLGAKSSFSFMFFTIVLGGIISGLYAFKLKKLKDVLVPFIPFVLFGYILTVGWGAKFFEFVFNF